MITKRNLLLWLAGILLAKLFFPFGILWLLLGSLAYFPLKDYVDLRETRKKRQLQEKRYLHLLEAANVYFQDSYSLGNFLQKLRLQAPPEDPEWSKIHFWMDQAYRSHLEHQGSKDFLHAHFPPEAELFLYALFGPEAFREQMREISLTSLRYFRQVLRLDLELEAGMAAQTSEAKIMLILPFLFQIFLPRLLLPGYSASSLGLLLSSIAWILALAALSIFLKMDHPDDSMAKFLGSMASLFQRIPSLSFFENLCLRLLQSKHSVSLQDLWHMRHSSGRTRLDANIFDPRLTQALAQTLSKIMLLMLSLTSLFFLLRRPAWVLGALILIPLLFFLKLSSDTKKSLHQIQEDFPSFQHRLYTYLIAGYSLDNAWEALLEDPPPIPLTEDLHQLHYLVQGGIPILEALTIWSQTIKATEIQESIALLQRYIESGSRDSLIRFGEQMIEQGAGSQMRQHIHKSQKQTRLMIPIMLDLISIIMICLIPALEVFGGFG